MSEVRVNKLSPRSGTTVTLGDSGDTITIPSGVTFDASSGGLAGTLTTAAQPNITSVGTLTSFASTGIDDNATSTAVTINSSGRLLVGTTTTTPATTTGVRLYEDGRGFFTADGTYVGYFNRLTSDGELIQLRKDGTTVGSINARAGDLTIGTGITGITFSDSIDAIRPVKVSDDNLTDNTTDIGSSSNRFQDLYLGGGLYVGGTGTANKLDDYEEGTWTPTTHSLSGFSGTITYSSATYVKIGKLVTLNLKAAASSSTGNLAQGDRIQINLGSLPFAPVDSDYGGTCGIYSFSLTANATVAVTPHGTGIRFFVQDIYGSPTRNGGAMKLTITYEV